MSSHTLPSSVCLRYTYERVQCHAWECVISIYEKCVDNVWFSISKITAEVNCCHNSPELTIPITIGSIPFVDNYHRIKRRPTISTLDERSKRTTPMPAEFLIDSKRTATCLRENDLNSITFYFFFSVHSIQILQSMWKRSVFLLPRKKRKKISISRCIQHLRIKCFSTYKINIKYWMCSIIIYKAKAQPIGIASAYLIFRYIIFMVHEKVTYVNAEKIYT